MTVSSELSHWLNNGAELTTELDRKSLQLEFDELLLSGQLKSNQLAPRKHYSLAVKTSLDALRIAVTAPFALRVTAL
jgi:hypothetical protein